MSNQKTRQIILAGADNLGNQMLVYSIERELGVPCVIYGRPIHNFPEELDLDFNILTSDDYEVLVLIDCVDRDIDQATRDIMTNPAMEGPYVACYNLSGYSEAEAKALARRVRGFFYKDDKMDIFMKGINSIFHGEIWISRQILLRYVMSNGENTESYADRQAELTQREQQILALVSVGVANEEIGEKLHISVNTVKTHMYNIFKKIQVTNRLQAALWAAKNL